MNHVQPWSLSGAIRAISAGETTAVDLVRQSFERIAEVEADVRAWVHLDEQQALASAAHLDAGPVQGLLHGIPVGVKDIIDVAGMPTECGSVTRAGRRPAVDAWFVRRLKNAGAVVVGKSVTTEFAYFAPGPTGNPHDLACTPGGSSSGSAAAVSAGMVPLALGSQTAASLTRPAAFCGVAGYVSPAASLPTDGIAGLSPTLDSLGLVTSTVEDLAVARAALAGSSRMPVLAGVVAPRLLIWDGTNLGAVSPAMLAGFESAVGALSRSGASATRLPWTTQAAQLVEAHMTVMAYESARELAAEAEHPELLSESLAALLAQGRCTSPADRNAALHYARAQRLIMLSLLEENDAVLAPAALGTAPAGLASTGSPVLSRPWQLLGLPVVTIPGLSDGDGMPLGVQLIGRADGQERLLELARWVEAQLHSRVCSTA
ncbi:amidase [Paenarthrobacter sp. PH39-S1]|uniref:amidase n=1 Tax=Paenarthrobacter sp. PH39-S1 TaxID=3046204 RepID=UPI0024BB0FE9|nr:amidase [Paenarthrobacter sp. PH39-S1]MDJ0358434.1 amidase [Paenarthrobacter sp. PH39-S1]